MPFFMRGSRVAYLLLKAWFRGRKYVIETLKLLPEMPDALFIDQVVSQMAALGRVNHAVSPA